MRNAFAFFTVSLLLSNVACAPVQVVPEPQRSPHFLTSAKHLDLGGHVFVYADLDGDVERITAFVANILSEIQKEDPDPVLARIDVPRLIGMLGLNPVLAVGLSSVKHGALFRNKAFIEYPGDKQGFMGLLGASAHAFETPTWAPADADLVIEQDFNYKRGFHVVESMIRHVAGEEAGEVLAELDQPIPQMHVSLRQIFEKLDGRMVAVMRIHEDRLLDIPGEKFQFPYTELAIGVDGLGFVFDDLVESFGGMPMIRVESADDFQFIQISEPLPEALAIYKPVLAKDKKTGRVYFATSLDLLREFVPGPKALGTTAGFVTATAGLPKTGNGLMYVSGDFVGKVWNWIETLGAENDELKMILKFTKDLLPEQGMSFSSLNAVLPDGLFFASNSPTSHKATILAIGYINPMLFGTMAAIAIPAFISYRGKAEATTLGGPIAIEPQPMEAVPAPAPDVAEPPPAPVPEAPRAPQGE